VAFALEYREASMTTVLAWLRSPVAVPVMSGPWSGDTDLIARWRAWYGLVATSRADGFTNAFGPCSRPVVVYPPTTPQEIVFASLRCTAVCFAAVYTIAAAAIVSGGRVSAPSVLRGSAKALLALVSFQTSFMSELVPVPMLLVCEGRGVLEGRFGSEWGGSGISGGRLQPRTRGGWLASRFLG
jgi:hypothetical protein